MGIIIIESIIFCILFTIMVFILSKNPLKTVYNYPPKIQERVKELEEYKDQIPTNNNKIFVKIFASIIMIILISLFMKYVNKCDTFKAGFLVSYILWTIVNWYDAIVMDCIWFCHDNRFIIKGTEDMKKEYHDYWFHIKGAFIGQIIGLLACLLVGLLVSI